MVAVLSLTAWSAFAAAAVVVMALRLKVARRQEELEVDVKVHWRYWQMAVAQTAMLH